MLFFLDPFAEDAIRGIINLAVRDDFEALQNHSASFRDLFDRALQALDRENPDRRSAYEDLLAQLRIDLRLRQELASRGYPTSQINLLLRLCEN